MILESQRHMVLVSLNQGLFSDKPAETATQKGNSCFPIDTTLLRMQHLLVNSADVSVIELPKRSGIFTQYPLFSFLHWK